MVYHQTSNTVEEEGRKRGEGRERQEEREEERDEEEGQDNMGQEEGGGEGRGRRRKGGGAGRRVRPVACPGRKGCLLDGACVSALILTLQESHCILTICLRSFS